MLHGFGNIEKFEEYSLYSGNSRPAKNPINLHIYLLLYKGRMRTKETTSLYHVHHSGHTNISTFSPCPV